MVRMKLAKIFNFTILSSLEYLLTWIAPKRNDGKRDFTILPAATTITDNNYADSKLQLFLNDSRTLFERHNKGNVTEFTTDTVRIAL